MKECRWWVWEMTVFTLSILGECIGSSTYTYFPAAVPNGQMTQYQETTKLSTRKERAEDIYDKHISSQNPLAIVLIAAI